MPFVLLADIVLIAHFGVVLFVVGGLLAVLVGNAIGWHWVNIMAFRLAHLVAIGVVVVQSWLGQLCPLTKLESWLRAQAGQSTYPHSFIEHWLGRLVYYDAPAWVFTLAYTLFGALVLIAWLLFPPRRNEPTPGASGG